MSAKKTGKQTLVFATPPSLLGAACVVGRKEGEGPLAHGFDVIFDDTLCGEKTWEKAESRMQQDALTRAADKAGLARGDVEAVFAGDLLNQCIGTTFGLREMDLPFWGLYGACSTMAESLTLASMAVDGGFLLRAAALTSSHFCSAERQYRLPLEYGGQRTPTAQWTVTGAGAVLLGDDGPPPYITHATIGKIVDPGVRDANHMGAAMAPAAYETIRTHLLDTAQTPGDYDLIVTGDLAFYGMQLVRDLFAENGVALGENYTDCGVLIYDRERQDVHAGGSGCGCSAVVLCSHLLAGMKAGVWNRILFCGTGALLSPVSTAQGESIPGICHAVVLSNTRE